MKYLISIFRILTAKKWVVVTLERAGTGILIMRTANHNMTTDNMIITAEGLKELAYNHAQCSAVDEVNEILKSK